MPIDLSKESPITLADAREHCVPRKRGRPVAPSTMWRWIHRGCRATDGTVVRLEVVRVGSQPMTTPQAVQRFIGELTERSQAVCETATPTMRTSAVEDRLRDAGLLTAKSSPDETADTSDS